jgi:CDP-diacylglycerol--glycerol-3-phosphate 3-phosphatidyltransferase
MAGCIVGAIVSDILDGIVARRLGVQTAPLRRFDSQTDLVFWICAAAGAWVLEPSALGPRLWQVGLLGAMEAACYIVSIARFGRETCTHALLAKAWGLLLAASMVALVGFGVTGALFTAMIIVGVVADAEVIAITLIIPRWTHDVPSVYHAWRLRRGLPIVRHHLFN